MRTGTFCPFCHTPVWTDAPTYPRCINCGHRADGARMTCDCSRCRPRYLWLDREAAARPGAGRVVAVDGDRDVRP